nr:hypothetical protein [Actinoplanes sp. N902-109]
MAESESTLTPGDVVLVGRAASVQFTGRSGFAFRIIAVDSRPTYDGWVWLDGYQLDRRGQAVARRRIFVCEAGLRTAGVRTSPAPRSSDPPGR